MSVYTTGEMAKLCGVSVRTVQYYDSRKILIPGRLSEGGRRLYSGEDLNRLRTICFLREIGLSIDNISHILEEDSCNQVICILLEEQIRTLKSDIAIQEKKLQTAAELLKEIKAWEPFSVESIQTIAFTMENRKKLKRIHLIMLAVGIGMDAAGIGTLVIGILLGEWLPFAAALVLVICCGIFLMKLYYEKTAYICPKCHAVFKPGLKEFLFSYHTPRTRKLICKRCGHKGNCVETYDDGKAAEKTG